MNTPSDFILGKYHRYASWLICPEWREQLERWLTANIPKPKKGGSEILNRTAALKEISEYILSLSETEAKAFILDWNKSFKLQKVKNKHR